MTYKIFLLFLSLIAVQIATGQSIEPSTSDCIQGYVISTYKKPSSTSPIDDIFLKWDFTESSNRTSIEIDLEIQPLNSCWLELEGSNRSELKTITMNRSDVGEYRLSFLELNAKCFKWKVIISDTSNNCVVRTDWQFTSFL